MLRVMQNPELKELEQTAMHHLMKGDEASKVSGAEEHYKAAGAALKEIKEKKLFGKSWEKYVPRVFYISRRRADEYIEMADGRKSLTEVRTKNAASKKKSRANPAGHPAGSDKESKLPENYDPFHEDCEDCDTDEEIFQNSVANHLAQIVAMRAYWTKQFGDWKKLKIPPDLLTLAKEAERELKMAVAELTKMTQRRRK